MKVSNNGLDLIKQFEGFSATPYKDVVGKSTIGYGHLIKKGEAFTRVSIEQATELLKEDCAIAETCVNTNVKTNLNQNQFDALVSFVYNLGCGAFKASTLLKDLNRGEFEKASNEFHKWNHAGGRVVRGLSIRRKKEELLFKED